VVVASAAVALSLTGGMVSAAPSDQDTTWMVAAHQSNLTEIAAGNAAAAQATTDAVRQLGQMFVTMHTQLDADLTAAADQLGVTLPDSPTPAQQQTLATVQAQQGVAFDSAWLASQISGHRATLDATHTEQQAGSDEAVLALANAAEPVIAQHLEQVTAASGGSTELAATGFPTAEVALVAIGLVAFGSALVRWPRRGTTTRQP
jgi:putative membrane protein